MPILSGLLLALSAATAPAAPIRVEVVVPRSLRAEPLTGRAFVVFSLDSTPEPRLGAGRLIVSLPFFGTDVEQLPAGTPAVIDRNALGYPLRSVDELPPGEYFAQVFVSVYTRFARADGHVIWAHMDEWEGQQFNTAPGTLVSEVRRVRVDAKGGLRLRMEVSRVLPPVVIPPDDEYVKRVRIQSRILTAWWGHPIYLGAVVLLPRGYDQHPEVRYPVIWEQGHFTLAPPLRFNRDTTQPRNQLGRAWLADSFPRMIGIRILHPSPYYDDSYAVNSANNGPFGDAIMQELIPYLEERFRVIREPWARVLTGGSTGGWEALALQIYHPKFFGGTWSFYPDPVDFRRYELMNLYEDDNAFFVRRSPWVTVERPSERQVDGQPALTVRQENQLNNARGSRRRGGENFAIWEATYGPTDKDGYPAPIWNDSTGVIDKDVARYWREHDYDLRDYLARNWGAIGPDLVGKIRVYTGDMDNFYLNLAVYLLEEFLEGTTQPYYAGEFRYGRPMKPHGWSPFTTPELVRIMADHIARNAPLGEPVGRWRY